MIVQGNLPDAFYVIMSVFSGQRMVETAHFCATCGAVTSTKRCCKVIFLSFISFNYLSLISFNCCLMEFSLDIKRFISHVEDDIQWFFINSFKLSGN